MTNQGDSGTADSSRPRRRPIRIRPRWALFMVCIVVGAAAVGFIAAQPTAPSSPPALNAQASQAGVQVSFPSRWRREPPPANPLLALRDQLALAPRTPAGAVLVIGKADTTDPSLLPQPLLAALRHPPTAQVVTLGELTYYRYLNLLPFGQNSPESLYALPTSIGTVIGACILPQAGSFASDCERILGTLTLTSGSVLGLGPSVSYARSLSDVINKLNAVRSSASAQLRNASDANAQAKAANELAKAHATAAAAVLTLSPGRASAANTELASALRTLANGYVALAGAAARNDARGYQAAQGSVATANAELQAAFAELAKLGYRIS